MAKLSTFFLVFTASFCLMVLELAAGRLISPFVGISIYTWTSVIGIFLLGILFDPLWQQAEKSTPEALANLKTVLPGNSAYLQEYTKVTHGLVLTDDFAPVDNFLTYLYRTPF